FARDLNQDGRADFGVRILGDTSPVYVQGTDGVFRQAFALPQQQAAWGFIDSTDDGSADIVAVNPFTGEVSLYPELRPGRAAPPTAAPRPKVTPIQLIANLRLTPPVFSSASVGASLTYTALQGQVTTTFTADRVLPGV